MFSPAKAITAGALVFAIGGAYLVAGLPGAKEALEPGAESPQARPVEYAAIPDGTYAVTLTDEDAVRTGFPHECLVAGKENTVTVTLVIEGTDWTEIQACSDGEPPFVGSHGTLRYEGDDVIFTEPDVPGHVSYAWQSDGTKLSLRLLEADPQYAPTEVLRFLFENDFIREKG